MATVGCDQSITGGHETFFDWRCNKCEENDVITEATSYCGNCSESYCDSCLRDHNRFLRGHTVIGQADKDDWGKTVAFHDSWVECSEHRGQSISMYCGHHDDVCCPVCAVLHHGEICRPKMSYVPNVAQGIVSSAEFNEFIAESDRLIARMTQIENEKSECQSAINASRESCKSDVEETEKTVLKHLEDLKMKSISEINQLHDCEEKDTATDIAQCLIMKQELDGIRQQMQPNIPVNEASLFITMKTSKNRLHNCNGRCEALSKSQMKTYSFQTDPSIQQLARLTLFGKCVTREENTSKESAFDCSDDTGNSSRMRMFETEPEQNWKSDFDWITDAYDVKIFTTREGITIKVYMANLTKAPVDCIVSAANDSLDHGGGVARVIADAAGRSLTREGDALVRKKGRIQVGMAVPTTAGDLPYNCVIHAVGPCWYDYKPFSLEDIEQCETDLYTAIMQSFFEAGKRGLKSIALPAISSAIFAVPEEICTYQYALATINYSRKSASASSETSLREIHFIDQNRNIVQKIQASFRQIQLDENRPYQIQKYVHSRKNPSGSTWGRGKSEDQKPTFSSQSSHDKQKMSSSVRRRRTFIPENETEETVKAPTLCQVKFAVEKIYEVADIREPPRKRQQSNSSSGYDVVETFDLPEVHWDILRTVEKPLLDELGKTAQISYDKGCVMITSEKHVHRLDDLKQAGLRLKDKETEEIPIDDTSETDAVQYCKDICESFKSFCCTYIADRKKIYAFSEKYEDLKCVQHQLLVKLGKIQVTGSRGRHLAIQKDDNTPKTEPKQKWKSDFDWIIDAYDVKTFTTREGITVKVYKANLLKAPVDCIVNAANDNLNHGGGVARVIADAAGRSLTREGDALVRKIGRILVGMAVPTTAGDLPYNCVIHAVGPCWYDYKPFSLEDIEQCEADLYMAIMQSFFEAEKRGLESIALPAISSAIFAVPEEICTYQYALATISYSRNSASASSKTSLREIHFIDINHNIVQKIQASFRLIQLDENRPYQIQKYVHSRKNPSGSTWGRGKSEDQKPTFSSQSSHDKQKMSSSVRRRRTFIPENETEETVTQVFEPFQFEQNGVYIFVFGINQRLTLCKGDLFKMKAYVLVTIEDQTGSGTGALSKSIKQKETNSQYSYEKGKQFSYRQQVGDVVVTCGFNNDFHKVYHVVFPFEIINEPAEKRKKLLMKAYDTIFKTAADDKKVRSLTMTIFGTGSNQEGVKLSSHAFLDSYLVHCNRCVGHQKQLEMNLVVFDEKFSVVLKTVQTSMTLKRMNKTSQNSPPLRPPKLVDIHRQTSNEVMDK